MTPTEGLYPPDYEYVPTQPELHDRGLAVVVARTSKGEPTHYRMEPEGQELVNEAMRRNAARCRTWDMGRRAA